MAIGISNSGRTSETIEMLVLAKASGAFTVAVTGDRRLTARPGRRRVHRQRHADAHLQPDDLSAKHAQLLVLDLLYLLIAQQDLATTADRLAAFARGGRRPPPAPPSGGAPGEPEATR